MKKVLCTIFVFIAFISYSRDFNCFTIIVGKKASYNGSVILAHNEDNNTDQAFVNIHFTTQNTLKTTHFILSEMDVLFPA